MIDTKTSIIIGASAYACVRYAGVFGEFPNESHHTGTIDIKLPGGIGAHAGLRRVAEEHRERAARELRFAAIAEAAAVELEMGRAS